MNNPEPLQKTALLCYHCGNEINSNPVYFDDKNFCCDGCQAVYNILQQNNLCNYYTLGQTPGTTIKDKINETRFEFLDLPEIQQQLIDFNDGEISRVTFYIPAVHCSSCIWLLEKLYRLNEGIKTSRLDFTRKQLSISFNPSVISLKKLVVLLASIGYEPLLSLNDVVKKYDAGNSRKLVKKIAVAGFCFGNIMLLSFPEYFGMDAYSRQNFPLLFNVLNIVLSLPVFFYSGWMYITSALKGIKQRYINIDVPLALGIVVLMVRSLYEILAGVGPGYFDTLAGLIFFLLLGKWFQSRTYDFLSFERDYKSYFPLAVTIIEKGKARSIPAGQIKTGNRLFIRHGEIIPADSILMRGNASIDYSFVTGETRPLDKVMGEIVYAGGRQVGAAIEVEVIKEISQSYLTQLWNNDAFSKEKKSRLVSFSDTVSRYFTIVLISLALTTTLFWLLMGDGTKAWGAFTAILIIACPCALALSTPFTMGNALRILGKNKFYLKNSAVVEKIAHINNIVFDKTGTLTYNNGNIITYTGELAEDEKIIIAAITKNSAHPLSMGIYEYFGYTALPDTDYCIETPGKGIKGIIGNKIIKIGNAEFTDAETTDEKNDFVAAATRVYVNINGGLKGYFTFHNKYREGVGDLTAKLTENYYLHVLSGDNEGEKQVLKQWFNEDTINFNCTPPIKLEFIKRLQEKNHQHVMMVGDGLNDAGALRQSDVGIAITDEVSNFTPACDAVLDAAEMNRLPVFMRFTKKCINVIHGSFGLSMMYNLIGLYFAVQGTMSPLVAAILMPISSVTVVSFTTGLTNLYAKRLKLLK